MSLLIRAAEIHQDAELTPEQLLARSREVAVSADIVPLTIIKLGDGSRNLDVHVPTLQQIAQTNQQLRTAAAVVSNISTFARTVAAAMKGGATLLDAVNNPDALLGLVSGLLPGLDAKGVSVAMHLGHDVLSLVQGRQGAGLSIMKDIGGAAGLLAKVNPYASLTDVLLSGVAALVNHPTGQDFQLERYLSGSLIALSKDLAAQAGVLTQDPGGDL